MMEEKPTDLYENMLRKYREVDEDEILSNLTSEELQQLEGEIDREVLNKIPEDIFDKGEEPALSSSSDQLSSTSEDDTMEWEIEQRRPKLSTIQTKHLNRSLEKQRSIEQMEQKRKSSKTSQQYKIPALKKTKSREELKRQMSEEGGELKKELIQAVKRRTKKRSIRANSSGLSRRYNRRNSSCLLRNRRPKVAKEERRDNNVNRNYITEEMLMLRPKLKKVKTREPAKVNDMLNGVSLSHITSGVKTKGVKSISSEEEESCSGKSNLYDVEETEKYLSEEEEKEDLLVNETTWSANDDMQKRELNQRCMSNDVGNDDSLSQTNVGSTSAKSCDVIGELSINQNSVEETLVRIWNDDPQLTEVNFNNIQNVAMEVFEELASAMECNTYVTHLSLANVGLTDKPTRSLASMLKKNKTLKKINLESNFITGEVALRLVAALRKNHTLTELRIENQRHIFGGKVEQEFSKILKNNRTLLRFGYQFKNPGPRMSASNSLTRNMDEVRKMRVMDQKRRVQASRPLIYHPSSKEQNDSAKMFQEKGFLYDLQHASKDEEIQNLLGQMNPTQYALLEQWFLRNILSDGENPPHYGSKKQNHNQNFTANNTQTPTYFSSNDQVDNRKDISSKKLPSKEQVLIDAGINRSAINNDALRSEEKAIPWKKEEGYDRNEFEVVQVEVSDRDGTTSKFCNPSSTNISKPIQSPTISNSILSSSSGNQHHDSPSTSWSLYRPQAYHNEDALNAMSRLHLLDKNLNSNPVKKLKFSTYSCPSSPSRSPNILRKLKDDKSWITKKPHY